MNCSYLKNPLFCIHPNTTGILKKVNLKIQFEIIIEQYFWGLKKVGRNRASPLLPTGFI